MASTLETLVVRLTADATKLEQELNKQVAASRTAGQKIGAAFTAATRGIAAVGAAAVGVTTAFTVAANNAARYADQIDKAALRTRLSRGAVQELTFAADQLGGSFGDVETAVNGLTLRLAGAEQGSERQTEAFRRLGVATRDAGGQLRATEDLFFDTVTALQGVSNETERAVLAQEVFGRSAASLAPILAAGAGSLEEVRAKAREFGIVLGDESIGALVAYKDQLSATTQQFDALRREITVAFLPVLTQGLLPAVREAVLPAFRDFAAGIVGVTDAFDESGQPTNDFKDRIETLAGAVGGFITDLVALGEVSVGLVQVLVSPFAALGNAIGQVSVGFGNFLDVYRRALSGDFRGFLDRPIDVLFPGGFEGIVDAFTSQAQVGLDSITRGAGRFGSFTGGQASTPFSPSTRTAGASGVGAFGSGAGVPDGTTNDPVAVRLANPFGGEQLRGRGIGPQNERGFVTIDPSSEFVRALLSRDALLESIGNALISDRGRTRGSGLMAGGDVFNPGTSSAMFPDARAGALNPRFQAALQAGVRAAELEAAAALEAAASQALIDSVREAGAARRQAYTIEANREADAAREVAAAEAAANQVIIDSVREAGALRRQAYTIEAGRESEAALAFAQRLADPFAGVPRAVPGRNFQRDRRVVPDFSFNSRDNPEAQRAARQSAELQRQSALEFRKTVVSAGVQFGANLVDAIRSGSPSGIGNALTGGIGSIISLFNPTAGGIFSILGGLFSSLLPNGQGQDASDATRAIGASARGAPSIELNLSVFQNLAVASLTGESRAAVDGLLNDTVNRIESVLTSFGSRLSAVEARTA